MPTPADPTFQPPPGAHLNEYGSWVDDNGDLVRTATGDYQRTPGAIANNAHIGTDSRGLQWMSNNATGGEKSFLSPYSRGIYDDPHDHDKSFFRGGSTWNSKTGEWEKGGRDWGNILSMVVAGTLTAGAASAMMGGGAAAEAAISSTVATGQVPAEIAAGGAAAGGGAGAAAGTAGATGGAGGLTAGGVVKAGLTGYSTLNKLGKIAGAGAKSEADSRRYDASLQGGMDANNNRAMVEAAKFNLGAPDQLLNRLARVGVGINAKDMGPTGDARIDKFAGGGLRPSLLQDPATQQGFKEAQRQSLLSLMNKDYQVNPTMSKIPEPGLMERAGGAFSTGAGLYDTAKGLWKDDTATKLADTGVWDPAKWSGPINNEGWEDLA